MSRVVVVGAGHAGGSVAAFLRQFGFEGEIVLIGEEPLVPYQRPPLSKAWLKGEADFDSLLLRPSEFYAEAGVDLRLGERVVEIDRRLKLVRLSNGEPVSYDHLVLATGSVTHKLPVPGGDHPALLELRTAADADKLKARLTPGARLIVVGAGYVGLEVAASARALGCEAIVVEREARVMARVASEPLSKFFEGYHRSKGVEILTGAAVTAIEAQGRAVRLADGRAVMGEAVLVGIGAAANDALARNAGLACDGGIVVDLEARTSDPAVFAVGDCTRRPLPIYEARARLESVPNALEQAKQAAAAIAGHAAPAGEVPWFWSDQYDLKLQMAGVAIGADRLIVRGDPAEAKFAVFHLIGDRVLAVEAVNAPPEFMAGKQLIAKRTPVDLAKLADPAVSMKAVAL
ncbi:FAD-dependent oxidoreductase [Caulobacter sp. 17J65-9]|uniref:NAD(P)/FAD-dependent oxidoreductase n=1 Tax=Caulobacter sp. 17J65-9 TaxID=2709382 RepID=UPI0013C99029|nr:FAD-dependent oxidoreductase [Caulobacter sp. 17J65-9]NEX92247.1 FAD-dependent oxidoreductase [Caulobacter sp. 17J65-9]